LSLFWTILLYLAIIFSVSVSSVDSVELLLFIMIRSAILVVCFVPEFEFPLADLDDSSVDEPECDSYDSDPSVDVSEFDLPLLELEDAPVEEPECDVEDSVPSVEVAEEAPVRLEVMLIVRVGRGCARGWVRGPSL